MLCKSVIVSVLSLCLMYTSNVLATDTNTSFQDEIRISCEKFALEDKIPTEEVQHYIELCIHDFNIPQPMDESTVLGLEEGIGSFPPIDEDPAPIKIMPVTAPN